MILTLDVETYYAKDYTLKKLTTEEYIRDPRFKVHGVGIKSGDQLSAYIWTDIEAFLKQIPWHQAFVLCHNCLPGDVEVLTKRGWVSLETATCDEEIMQWDHKSNRLSWVYPTHKTESTANQLLQWDTNFHSCSYTFGHRMYYTTPNARRNNEWKVATAEEVAKMGPNNTYIPLSGEYYPENPIALSDDECRLMEAIRADGSWVGASGVRFKFKKERKILRLRRLLALLDVPFREYVREEATNITCNKHRIITTIYNLLKKEKRYSRSWVLDLPFSGRRAILDEMQYWDGSTMTEHSFGFATVDFETVEAVRLMAHCSNRCMSVGRWASNNRGYGEAGNSKPLWVGMVRGKQMAKLVERAEVVSHDGPVYCFTVPTGAFMVRSNGTVHITGNCRFDAAILSWKYGIRPKFLLDTLSMARAVFPHESGSLANLSKICGLGEKGHELESFMGKRDLTEEEQVRLGLYCMNDVDLTYALFHKLKAGFPPSELKVIDQTLRMFTEPVLELDTKILYDHLQAVQAKQAKLLDGRDLTSLRSNPQFAKQLEALGVTPPKKISAKTGKETFAFAKTDEGMLSLLEHDDVEVQALAAARLGVKSSIEESRTKAFLGISERGTFPIALDYFGARNSSRFGGAERTNVQNLPKGGALRKSIVAPAGHILVVSDFSAIEARVSAWQAGQADLLDQFCNGEDVYCQFASRVYAREITKENDPKARAIGKASILGMSYGMGWRKAAAWVLSGPLGMPPITFSKADLDAMGGFLDTKLDCNGITTKLTGVPLQAHCSATKHLVDSYRQTYTQIPRYWRTCNQILDCMYRGVKHQFGVLSTGHERLLLPNGLSIHYKGLTQDGDSWHYVGGKGRQNVKQHIFGSKIFENAIQALSRIVMTDAMLEIGKYYRVVLTVHDEIVVCVREEEADEAADFISDVMSKAPPWCKDLPVACETGVSKSYGEAK